MGGLTNGQEIYVADVTTPNSITFRLQRSKLRWQPHGRQWRQWSKLRRKSHGRIGWIIWWQRKFHGLNFDKAVDALIPLIHSDMSVTACVATCDASAATVLGPFATLAHTVCTPLCDGALAKLEEISG